MAISQEKNDVPRLARQAHFAYRQTLIDNSGIVIPEWPATTDATKEAWCEAVTEVLRRAN